MSNVHEDGGAVIYPEGYAPKKWLTALILAILLGIVGVHRFYTGKVGTGILQLFTMGGIFIWTLIDIIFICTGKFKDKKGYPLQR